MPLSINRASFEQDWQFQFAVHQLILTKAKRLSGQDWNLDAWDRVLQPVEFDLLLISHFIGVWENNGRYIDTVKAWEDEFDRVDRAFRRMGFKIASVLMPRALELDALQEPYLAREAPLPIPLEAEVKRVNEAALKDVSEERLTRVIGERGSELDV